MSEQTHKIAIDGEYEGTYKAPKYRGQEKSGSISIDQDSGVDV